MTEFCDDCGEVIYRDDDGEPMVSCLHPMCVYLWYPFELESYQELRFDDITTEYDDPPDEGC